jgi:hypothetical protein
MKQIIGKKSIDGKFKKIKHKGFRETKHIFTHNEIIGYGFKGLEKIYLTYFYLRGFNHVTCLDFNSILTMHDLDYIYINQNTDKELRMFTRKHVIIEGNTDNLLIEMV